MSTLAKRLVAQGMSVLASNLGEKFTWDGGEFRGIISFPTSRFGPGPTGFKMGVEYNTTIRARKNQFTTLPSDGMTLTAEDGKRYVICGKPEYTTDISVKFTVRIAGA